MIADGNTNMVYFSGLLKSDVKFASTCREITHFLDVYKINYGFLEGTKDIWARDYMSIQVTEKIFIEYRYDPNYLQGSEKGRRDLKSYPDIICDILKLKTQKTDIILDGGNIVKSSNCVILTDKVLTENKQTYNRTRLIAELKNLFEVDKVVIIPRDPSDEYGHADGILRFINNNTVLVNEYFDYYKSDFQKHFFGAFKSNRIDVEKLVFKVAKKDKRNWAYINFLQLKDLIIIPKFGIDEDEQALHQFNNFFPDYAAQGRIISIDATQLVKKSGALNCISWNIKT